MSKRREVPEDQRVYIRDAADTLDRRIGTLRKWESSGVLPKNLLPARGKRGWRYWTPEQIEGIKKWIEKTDRRPGRGLPHVDQRNADPDLVQQQIRAMRKPRTKKTIQAERERPSKSEPVAVATNAKQRNKSIDEARSSNPKNTK